MYNEDERRKKRRENKGNPTKSLLTESILVRVRERGEVDETARYLLTQTIMHQMRGPGLRVLETEDPIQGGTDCQL